MLKHASILFCFCMTTFAATIPDLAELNRMIARFAPATLTADTSKLSPGDKQALAKLLDAARVIDDIFQVQLWSGNPALKAKLAQDSTPLGKARYHYFLVEQRPVVGSGRSCSVRAGCPTGEASRREFLSQGHDQAGV